MQRISDQRPFAHYLLPQSESILAQDAGPSADTSVATELLRNQQIGRYQRSIVSRQLLLESMCNLIVPFVV